MFSALTTVTFDHFQATRISESLVVCRWQCIRRAYRYAVHWRRGRGADSTMMSAQQIVVSHGITETSFVMHDENPFTVTGILANAPARPSIRTVHISAKRHGPDSFRLAAIPAGGRCRL